MEPQKSNYQKPLIGIIGGCGPFATIDIESKILRATLELNKPHGDQDFYPMFVMSNTQLMERSRAFNAGKVVLTKQLEAELWKLESQKVKIFLIACHSAHAFLNDSLTQPKRLKFISLVDSTVNEVTNNYPKLKKIGVLGTAVVREAALYDGSFKGRGIETLYVPKDLERNVLTAIQILKTELPFSFNSNIACDTNIFVGRARIVAKLDLCIKRICEGIEYLMSKNVDKIILGCTELPLILQNLYEFFSPDIFVDPNYIGAFDLVKSAKKIESFASRD